VGVEAQYDRGDDRRGATRLSDEQVLRLERVLDAPPERIFAAWTDPGLLRRWWAAQPDWTTPEVVTDVRVGGRYRLSMQDAAGSVRTVVGEYLEVDPPRRLVYTWRWEPHDGLPAGGDVTVVTVEFVAEGAGTRVVLEQRGFAGEEDRAQHDHGWRGCLDNLERRLIRASSARA
jgi:uncharacterized protein YndB with AHSA1/START domain